MTKENDNTDENLTIENQVAEFVYLPNQNEHVNNKLHYNKPLVITGSFTAQQVGVKKLVATLAYREAKQPVSCVTQAVSVVKDVPQGNPAVAFMFDDGYVWFGNANGMTIQNSIDVSWVKAGKLACNVDSYELVCLGKNGNGCVYNLERKEKSQPFQLGNHILKVLWNEDLQHYIAVGDRGSVYLSSNGREWNTISIKKLIKILTDISWSSSLQRYVVIGAQGTIITSSDGKNWEVITSPVQDNLVSIACSNKQYLVICKNLDPNLKSKNGILTSTDGLNWEHHADVLPAGVVWNAVTWHASSEKFIAVGNNRWIISSSDDLNWLVGQLKERRLLSGRTPNFDLTAVLYSKLLNGCVAIGTQFAAYYSASGDTEKNRINNQWSNITASVSSLTELGNSRTFSDVVDIVLPN